MKRSVSILLLVIMYGVCFSQTHTVSGYVVDSQSRETLIGVTVVDTTTGRGVSTDGNGFFRLPVSSGSTTLRFTYVGYSSLTLPVEISGRSVLLDAIELTPMLQELASVVIVADRHSIGDREVETSQLRISPQTIQNIPAARGDIFRAIRYLPGIGSTEPFSPLYSARGADPSGNLVLLDGVTVYNPYHFALGESLFNIQSVKNVDVLVGGFGAEFGGRNASILHITTKDGSMNKFQGEVEPTTTHTRLFLEFPVGNSGSMMVAGRYYYDLVSYFLLNTRSYFYDANVSYTNRISNRNRLTLKVFSAYDDFNMRPDRMFSYISNTFDELDWYDDTKMHMKNRWSNQVATAYLKTVVSPSVFLHTQVYGSFHSAYNHSSMEMIYDFDTLAAPVGLRYSTDFTSSISDLCAKSSVNIKIGSYNTLNLGVEANRYFFKNTANINWIDKGESIRQPYQLSAFIEDKLKVGGFIVRPGLRLSHYSYYEGWQLEPRVNAALVLPWDIKLKAAWGLYNQSIISMNTQEYEINQFLDYYYPLRDLEPSQSVHYIIGGEGDLTPNASLSLDLYYIDMPVVYTFDLNQSEMEAYTFSDKLQRGVGESYGAEIKLSGNYPQLSGWVSYGYSRSTRSYPHIMDGEWFLFDFDRTHSIKAMTSYRIAPRLTYNFTFTALSGLPRTVETVLQNYYFYEPLSGGYSFYPFGVSERKNNARLPWLMDIDMGIKKRIRGGGFGADLQRFLRAEESYFTVSIGNILFLRRNVLYYFPFGGDRYIPIGLNYLPKVTAGYSIKF